MDIQIYDIINNIENISTNLDRLVNNSLVLDIIKTLIGTVIGSGFTIIIYKHQQKRERKSDIQFEFYTNYKKLFLGIESEFSNITTILDSILNTWDNKSDFLDDYVFIQRAPVSLTLKTTILIFNSSTKYLNKEFEIVRTELSKIEKRVKDINNYLYLNRIILEDMDTRYSKHELEIKIIEKSIYRILHFKEVRKKKDIDRYKDSIYNLNLKIKLLREDIQMSHSIIDEKFIGNYFATNKINKIKYKNGNL